LVLPAIIMMIENRLVHDRGAGLLPEETARPRICAGRPGVDRFAAGVMGALGLKLIFSSARA
jgi:hypothetical protein